MAVGSASRNYMGGVWLTHEKQKINAQVRRFPLSWQGRLKKALGAMNNALDVARWSEKVAKLTEAERGGISPDASDAEICRQAEITALDMVSRLRDVVGVWLVRRSEVVGHAAGMPVVRGWEDRGGLDAEFVEAMQALAVREILVARGLDDLWPGGTSSEKPDWKPGQRAAWIKRVQCVKFWRRVYRKLHARTVEAVATGIGLVRKTAGLYCSDDAVKRSGAQDVRNAAVMQSVYAVNEQGQAYALAELAAKGTANQEIRRVELLTRIAGFELIAKDCGHMAVMVTVTCPSRFHAATTRGDGRVVNNPKWAGLTAKDGQDYLAKQWRRCRAAAARAGLEWYGFRIAEPQHDGTPHWHCLLFFPHGADGVDSLVLLQALVRKYFLFNDSPDEPGARKYRVDFELIDWSRGRAVGYVIKYISKNIDGHGVGLDLFGNDAVTSSQRVRAWAKTWRIRQFQQIGGAPVTIWRELRRVHPEALEAGPGLAVNPIAEAVDAVNPSAVQPGAQAVAWAEYTKRQGGHCVKRRALRVRLLRQDMGKTTRYGEKAAPVPVGVWTEGGVEYFRNHIHQMNPSAAPFERAWTLGIESERSQWLIGFTSKAQAMAVAPDVFERIGAAERTRIHVNNCTRAPSAAPSDFRRRVARIPKLGVFRTFDTAPGRSPGIQNQ